MDEIVAGRTAVELMQTSIDLLVPSASRLIGRWYDRTAAATDGMPPHVTLLWPWRPAPITASAIGQVRDALAGLGPFDLTFEACGQFPGVLFLEPSPPEPIAQLIARLAAAFPETPPYGGVFGDAPPAHLTVAKSVDDAALAAIRHELEDHLARTPFTVRIDRVSLSEEGLGPDGTWAVRHEHLLT